MGACCRRSARNDMDQKEEKFDNPALQIPAEAADERKGKPTEAPQENPDDVIFREKAAQIKSTNADTNVPSLIPIS